MPERDFTEAQYAQAWALKWRAEFLAGCRRDDSPLAVPTHWTTWLLMEKAGAPRDLIAGCAYVERRYLDKRIRAAKTMLIFAPFAKVKSDGKIWYMNIRLRHPAQGRKGAKHLRAIGGSAS